MLPRDPVTLAGSPTRARPVATHRMKPPGGGEIERRKNDMDQTAMVTAAPAETTWARR